jgi:hypothetical protein
MLFILRRVVKRGFYAGDFIGSLHEEERFAMSLCAAVAQLAVAENDVSGLSCKANEARTFLIFYIKNYKIKPKEMA